MSSGGKGIELAEGGHADADATKLKASSSAVMGQQTAAVDDALGQPPQQNWIIAWIKGQIKGFSFPLVLMAIKFVAFVTLQLTACPGRLFRRLSSWACIDPRLSRMKSEAWGTSLRSLPRSNLPCSRDQSTSTA